MNAHDEIHDRIQKCNAVGSSHLDILDILEVLNDKLAGIEERLRDCERRITRAEEFLYEQPRTTP